MEQHRSLVEALVDHYDKNGRTQRKRGTTYITDDRRARERQEAGLVRVVQERLGQPNRRPVGPTENVSATPPDVSEEEVRPPDLSSLKLSELEDLAATLGLDLEALPRTGLGGRRRKSDLIPAIDAARAERGLTS